MKWSAWIDLKATLSSLYPVLSHTFVIGLHLQFPEHSAVSSAHESLITDRSRFNQMSPPLKSLSFLSDTSSAFLFHPVIIS